MTDINNGWFNIGGANVPGSMIKSQRTEIDTNGKEKFIIDLTNGVSIQYGQQKKGTQISTSFHFVRFNDATIVGSDKNDDILLENCTNTKVATRYGGGKDEVRDCNGKNNTIFVKAGDKYVNSTKSSNTYYEYIPTDATFYNGESLNSKVHFTEKYTE